LNFPLYIAKRYLFSKSKNNAINIITGIASVGIIVGTLALFVVLSVFSGLRDFSLSFTNTIDPDLKVTPIQGKSFFITSKQDNQIAAIKGIASYSKVVEERVLFYFDGKEQVTYLKGVDKNYYKINTVSKSLFNGNWLRYNTAEVVIGYGISQKLSLGLFDFNNPFEVYVPRKGKAVIESEAEAFNKSVLIPVGIYAISEDLDSKYVFSDLRLAQDLLEYKKNQISSIEIKTVPNFTLLT
jgi:lipoprotein-releasing system permease protein